MANEKNKPSTALTATGGLLPEPMARRMVEWRRLFSGPPLTVFLQRLARPDAVLIETLDGKPLDGQTSYLALETITNRIVGVIRDGSLSTLPEFLTSSRTRCTLLPAAKA